MSCYVELKILTKKKLTNYCTVNSTVQSTIQESQPYLPMGEYDTYMPIIPPPTTASTPPTDFTYTIPNI